MRDSVHAYQEDSPYRTGLWGERFLTERLFAIAQLCRFCPSNQGVSGSILTGATRWKRS